MERCPNCGATVRDDARFCTACGYRMAERPADQTAPVFASGAPALTSARDESPATPAQAETHGTFWQRIEEATSQSPRGDGFDAWETRFQRPGSREEAIVPPAGATSSGGVTTGEDTALVTWPGGASGQGDTSNSEWAAAAAQRPGWANTGNLAAPEGEAGDLAGSSDDRVLDHAAAMGADRDKDLAGAMPSGPSMDVPGEAVSGDATPSALGRPAGDGSLLAGMQALAASLTVAANGDGPDFDRHVGELREILERARSRPRDIDIMMQISERLDTITELAASHERMTGVLREAARQLGGPSR